MLKSAFVGLFEAKPTRTFCISRLNRSLKKWVLAPPSILALALPSAIGRVISIQSHTVQGGFRGFYFKNTVTLAPKVTDDIHKCGGTILGTSRGGHDTMKIVDRIQDRGINQVYIIGGDGTQKGAAAIYEVGK